MQTSLSCNTDYPLTAPVSSEADAIRPFFNENGYYIARGVFSPSELNVLEADFDHIVSQLLDSGEEVNARWGGAEMKRLGAGGTTIFHTHNVQCYSEAWMRALLQKRFLDIASVILGPDIILHHTKLFQKPQGKGSPFPMHQDWGYFPTVKDTMIAGVIHVSEATDDMGCFRVYPGSHKLGRRKGTTSMGEEDRKLLDQYPLEGGTVLEAQPGDVVFFHYFTLHGSKQNISDKVRKTVLVQLHSGQDKIEDGNTHSNERLVLRGWNHAATRKLAGS